MTTTTAISARYFELMQRFPLHPIRTRGEYDAAADVLDGLIVRERHLDDGERDYLEMLEMLIESYDEEHFKIGPDRRTPLQRLRHLMQQVEMTPTDLMKVLGASQSLVSLILNGKRELSKANIRKLADHFKLDPSYFF